ncbi:MAG: pyruvate kinase, partial [Actinobacteria bacterium]
VLTDLIRAGVDVFRFNLSHGNQSAHRKTLRSTRKIAKRLKKDVGILFDLAGPKIRVGIMKEETKIRTGQDFTLTSRKIVGDEKEVSVNQPKLVQDLKKGDTLFLDEGKIELKVKKRTGSNLICLVKQGGILSSAKGINVTVPVSIRPLTRKDREDIEFAIQENVDWLALSFVRSSNDIKKLKRILKQRNASISVMAKIEKREAVVDIDAIIDESDAVMIARGDLGIELPVEEVPLIQKKVIARCMEKGRVVVTATQMLESMIRNPRPTRAEVNDIANSIFDQTDAVMLSGETAIGKFTVKAFKTMAKVVCKTEEAIDYGKLLADKTDWVSGKITDAISFASCELVNDLSAALLVTSTQSGSTAIRSAAYRCPAPILAVTPEASVVTKLKLVFGVVPLLIKPSTDINDMFAKAKQGAIKSTLVRKKDKIVITAGALVNNAGTTNLIKVDVI